MVYLLIFEHAPEAFHRGVVVAISFPAHARPHPAPFKQRGVFLSVILADPIRAMNQPRRRSFGGQRSQKGLDDQILRHTLRHVIAYDFPFRAAGHLPGQLSNSVLYGLSHQPRQ